MKFPADKPIPSREKVRSRRERQFLRRENCRPLRDQCFQRGETTVHSGAAILRLLKIGLEGVGVSFGEAESHLDAMNAILDVCKFENRAVNGVFTRRPPLFLINVVETRRALF